MAENGATNVNYRCPCLARCVTSDMGNSRPLCPENHKICPYNPESPILKFLYGPK